MKILDKGKMINNTVIQIEDWSEDYKFMPYGSIIAAYPISKHSLDGQFSPKRGRSFRFQIDFNSYEEAKEVFNKLVTGKKSLTDYKGSFNGDTEHLECV